MKIFFLAALLLISACTTKPVEVIYTSTWREEWQNEILEECNSESHLFTMLVVRGKIDSGYNLTVEDISHIKKMLLQSCLKYHGLFI
jgi:hypothetical protein